MVLMRACARKSAVQKWEGRGDRGEKSLGWAGVRGACESMWPQCAMFRTGVYNRAWGWAQCVWIESW